MPNINIQFDKILGKMKPMHGVNSGPRTKVFTYDASDLFRQAGIPISRLHDVEYPYGSGEFVDIHCVFPNFDADENDPASYNFGLTDCYIAAIREVGSEVFYRLGESIEHAPVKRHIHPPKDFAKWARICEHIVRHYNEGWADGHYWNIRHWEIWNEPDLDVNSDNKRTWSGTVEQFYDFYETAAKHLKVCFPQLLIGGPALAGSVSWATNFLREMQKRNVPMNFFSWHRYADKVEVMLDRCQQLAQAMEQFGYADAEMYIDEWNYMEDWNNQPPSFKKLVGMRGAAFGAASMIAFQNTRLDMATYFEADVIKEWCGLFEVQDMSIGSLGHKTSRCLLKPRKTFYSFYAFNCLYRLGRQVESKCDKESGIYTCAATNGGNKCAVMLATYRSALDNTAYTLTLNALSAGTSTVSLYLTDKDHDNECVKTLTCDKKVMKIDIQLSDEQVWLITWESNA